MTEGKGYCHRRLTKIREKQLEKDLEDLEKGKIVVIDNRMFRTKKDKERLMREKEKALKKVD